MESNGRHPVVGIRGAVEADGAAVADVWLRSFRAALPSVRLAHTDDEVSRWLRETVLPRGTTWVATADESPVGLMVLEGTELEQLYLAPEWQGRGVGGRFIALAKQLSPPGLELWTFQVNLAAQAFYEGHGFAETGRTDGHANQEREPDIRYVWPGSVASGPPEPVT